MSKNKRIAINTSLLYVRMFIIMLLTLLGVRWLFEELGVEDYGIYNVVSGVITSMGFVTSVMMSATLRYYSFSLGKNDFYALNRFFSASVNIYILIIFLVLLVGETFGVWFVANKLVIPSDRLAVSLGVYHFGILAFVISVISIPFSSLIIAYENMSSYSIITIIDAILKLLIILLLVQSPFDKLLFYSFLLLLVCVVTTASYIVLCKYKYPKCQYVKCMDLSLYKELLGFSGWTLFGTLANVMNNQGNTILINLFFGPMVNASRAVAMQVSNAISSFSTNFMMAVRPALIKSYAESDFSYLEKLYYFSTKFVYYLMLMLCLPLFFQMDFILSLWLKNVSPDLIVFSKLTIIYVFVLSLNSPITTVIQATGDVKRYFLTVESFTLLSMPFTYLAYSVGMNADSTYYIMIIVFVIAHYIRLVIIRKQCVIFTIKNYFRKFLAQALLITLFSTILILIFYFLYNYKDWIALFCTISISTISIFISVFFIALTKEERLLVKEWLRNTFSKFRKYSNSSSC